jgi:hypothetical protein
MLMTDPILLKLLKLNEDPMEAKPNTLTASAALIPQTLHEEANLAKLRNDVALPKRTKSTTDVADPSLTKLLMEQEDPR